MNIDYKTLKKCINNVYKACGKKYGILFDIISNQLWLVATDEKRLSRTFVGTVNSEYENQSFCIKKEDIQEIKKMSALFIGITIYDNTVTFTDNNGNITCIQQYFPNYKIIYDHIESKNDLLLSVKKEDFKKAIDSYSDKYLFMQINSDHIMIGNIKLEFSANRYLPDIFFSKETIILNKKYVKDIFSKIKNKNIQMQINIDNSKSPICFNDDHILMPIVKIT